MFLDVVEGGIGRDCHLLLSSVNGEANAFIPGETHFFSNNRDMCAVCTKVLPELHSWRNTSRPCFTWNDTFGNPRFLKIDLIVWFVFVFGMLQYSVNICS